MSFLVVGEALVDLISEPGSWRFTATPGGSPLNVAIGLAAAGQPVRLASRIGEDMFGSLLRDHLRRHGVDLRDLSVTAEPTSLAFAHLDRDGVASYEFRLGWGWRGPADLNGVSCLQVGSLGSLVEPGASAVRAVVDDARQLGIPVSYDPNVRPAYHDPAHQLTRIESLVAAADVVKSSGEDLAALYPDTPPLTAAAGWAAMGPRLVVVTFGDGGATALLSGELIECPAASVAVVDTVGAGDAFTAGLLAALATEGGFVSPGRTAVTAALQWAVATATAVCLHRGALPAQPATISGLLAAGR